MLGSVWLLFWALIVQRKCTFDDLDGELRHQNVFTKPDLTFSGLNPGKRCQHEVPLFRREASNGRKGFSLTLKSKTETQFFWPFKVFFDYGSPILLLARTWLPKIRTEGKLKNKKGHKMEENVGCKEFSACQKTGALICQRLNI